MKKLTLTIAIVFGLTMTTFADGIGLFQRNINAENGKSGYILYEREEDLFAKDPTAMRLLLPGHDLETDVDADETPLGSGIIALMGLGAAYLVAKKRREE